MLTFSWKAPYADFIRTSICILAGVPPVMLFAIMFIDGTWGGFIHVGENFMKNARFGFLGKFILHPAAIYKGTCGEAVDRFTARRKSA